MDDRERAFTDYVHARGTTMLRTAVHLCAGDVGAAEDLVQNTLVRTYVSWHQVRDPALRDAYVRRIMVRTESVSSCTATSPTARAPAPPVGCRRGPSTPSRSPRTASQRVRSGGRP